MTASITPISSKSLPDRAEPTGQPEPPDRVVLQFGGRVLKGFVDQTAWEQATAAGSASEHVPFRLLGADRVEDISLEGMKAAFFVKRFDGPGLDEMRFHDRVNPMASLWVRVVFRDGEIIEGLVSNGAAFVLQAGFFLTPTDPEANHWLIFVAKGQLSDFQVLGLRPTSRTFGALREGA